MSKKKKENEHRLWVPAMQNAMVTMGICPCCSHKLTEGCCIECGEVYE